MLRGRIIAGISSKSEVLSQLRAKEDSYTVLKGWNITIALGHETASFTKMGLRFIQQLSRPPALLTFVPSHFQIPSSH